MPTVTVSWRAASSGSRHPICAVLRESGVQIAPSTYYATKNHFPSAREQRDAD